MRRRADAVSSENLANRDEVDRLLAELNVSTKD
jgi:hypothetical protein